MSGIAGLIDFTGCHDSIQQMTLSIKHRGIDGIGYYENKNVHFANLKLIVTPESEFEKQPHHSNKLIITADARIDNRDELITQLDLKPTYTDCVTDSEIILAAYQRWGEDCLYHLIGDFAFAIWDETKQQLFCGRDHMGVRPFYYYHKKGRIFAFASEIKALLALDFVSKEVDEQKIEEYLAWLTDHRTYEERTFYKDVLSLKPAHCLIFDKNNLRKKFCWDFNLDRFSHLKTDEDFINAFKELFFEAVRCRIRTKFQIASHLSGGLDSSSVSCVASKLTNQTIYTLYYDLKDESCDEKNYVEEILKEYAFCHHWLSPKMSLKENALTISKIFDRPDHSTLPASIEFACAEICKQNNCRVLLSGHEGDTVVGYGNGYISELLDKKDTEHLKLAIKKYATYLEIPLHINKDWQKLNEREKYLYTVNKIVKYRFADYLKNNDIVGAVKFLLFSYRYFEMNLWYVSITFFIEIIKYLLRINKNADSKANLKTELDIELIDFEQKNKKHFYRIFSAGIIDINEQSNHIAAHYNFEYVHPLLDKRLIELCLIIPEKLMFGDGIRRFVFRKAMTGILPDFVRLRTNKVDFSKYLEKIANKITPQSKNGFKHTLRAFYLKIWMNYLSD